MRLSISRLSLALLATLLLVQAAWAEFTIRSVETRLHNDVYQLNANIDFRFSEATLEALQNGVPLIILLDIEVERHRKWWLNKTVAELQQGYLLLYHALSEKYIVNNLNSGAQENYDSLGGAIASLGRIQELPIIDAQLVDPGNRYTVSLRTYLDLEALPAPMRPLAYISSQWRLESDWYTWPLQQ